MATQKAKKHPRPSTLKASNWIILLRAEAFVSMASPISSFNVGS